MVLSPIFLFFLTDNEKIEKDELFLWGIMPLMFLSSLTYPDSFRFSTVAYSCAFILVFILYRRLIIYDSLSITNYRKLIKFVIYSYFFVLLVQQACAVFHLPIFNLVFYQGRFKLNSLSYEASHLATLLPLLMYSMIKTDEILANHKFGINDHIKKYPILWLVFLYTIFSCGSSTVFFTFPVFLLYFFKGHVSIRSIVGIMISCVVGLYLINVYHPNLFDRQIKLIPAILSFNPNVVILADSSAATRVIPPIELINRIVNLDPNLLIGYGIDYSDRYFTKMIVNDESRNIGVGGMVAFILDYGIVAGLLFVTAVKKMTSNKLFSYEMFYYFTCFFIFGFNMFLTWAFLILMSTNKFNESCKNKTFVVNVN